MGKKLVRIDVDVWGGGMEIREFPIVKESGHVVFIMRTRERRNPETGYKEKVNLAGPFNRKDIKIHQPRPGVRRGYIISEAEDPLNDAGVRSGIQDMLREIHAELSIAERNLLEFEIKG